MPHLEGKQLSILHLARPICTAATKEEDHFDSGFLSCRQSSGMRLSKRDEFKSRREGERLTKTADDERESGPVVVLSGSLLCFPEVMMSHDYHRRI